MRSPAATAHVIGELADTTPIEDALASAGVPLIR
jgi:hypothetical protein